MKNSLFIKQKGKQIRIDIACHSEETANRIFELVQSIGINLARSDLEEEWKKK